MKTISLKDAIQNLNNGTRNIGYNTDLFKGDSELIEDFKAENYQYIIGVSTDVQENKFVESFLCIDGIDSYLVNAVHKIFMGESQTAIYEKWLTLKGFNYFLGKALEGTGAERIPTEAVEYYNSILKLEGYDICYQDILDLGEYSVQYNSTSLIFTVEDEKHILTVNKYGMLSSIKRIPSQIVNVGKMKTQFKSILQ